jgi:hypothetical protein
MNTPAPITSEALCNYHGLQVERHPMPTNAAGFLDKAEPPKFVAVNSLLSPVQQEITIAHETGHFLISHKHLLSNHPLLRWINRERKHPLARKLSTLFMHELDQHFDTEFFADLYAISQFSVMGQTDLNRLIVEHKPKTAPWVLFLSVAAFFLAIKRHFIPCAIRFFFFQIWI